MGAYKGWVGLNADRRQCLQPRSTGHMRPRQGFQGPGHDGGQSNIQVRLMQLTLQVTAHNFLGSEFLKVLSRDFGLRSAEPARESLDRFRPYHCVLFSQNLQ